MGSMLAYRELNYKPSNENFVSKTLPMLGLYLIAYSILFFDAKTPHPSFHTLIPIIGVALIIGFASKDELVGKVLGSKPFVWVGLISYSAYLWHFPVFAFSRMGKEPTNYDKFEWIIIIFILSLLSYFFVERPFRFHIKGRNFFILCVSVLITLSVFSILSIKYEGLKYRFSDIEGLVTIKADWKEYREELKNRYSEIKKENPIKYGSDDYVIIVGNSHARDFYVSVMQDPKLSNVIKFDYLGMQIRCFIDGEESYNFFNSSRYLNAKGIIVASRMQNDSDCEDGSKKRVLSDIDGLKVIHKHIIDDAKDLIIIGMGPEFKEFTFDKAIKPYKNNLSVFLNRDFSNRLIEDVNTKYFNTRDLRRRNFTLMSSELEKFALEKSIYYFDKYAVFCGEKYRRCYGILPKNGQRAFYDTQHLTIEGAKYFGDALSSNSSFLNALKNL